MFQLLNRMTWVVSVILGIAIFAIEEDFFFFALIAVFATKFFIFSPNYIRERLQFFKTQVLKGYNPEQGEAVENISVSSPAGIETKEILPSQENLAFAENNTDIKTENVEVYEQSVGTLQTQKSSEPNILQKFFAENLLAKLGGILVFLGVLFFLSLIYTIVGPVAKMVIGFLLSAGVYLTGVWLDKKGFKNESRILMGTALLINYLVILSGRYLLGDGNGILSVGTMFFFLILNTLLAVMTSLLYRSRTLLIFSFIFAYLNPFLLGEPSSEPYTLLGYTMIVTLGAMYLAWKQKDEILFPVSFVFAALMFLLAPWSDANAWIAKLLCVNILGVIGLYIIATFKEKYQQGYEILIGGVFFLIGIMGLLGMSKELSVLQYGFLGFSSLGLMLWSYHKAKKGAFLYSIGSLGMILTLSPAIMQYGNTHVTYTLVSLSLILCFAFANIIYPLVLLHKLKQKHIGNILFGLISGALFLSYMIYIFGNVYFPGMYQGFVFLALATVYATLSYMVVGSIGLQKIQAEEKYSQLFYSIAALAVSIFSLAVAFVFSEIPEIICIIWTLEASVMFFLATRISSHKIAFGALALFSIGLLKLFSFFAIAGIQSLFPFLGNYHIAGNYDLTITLAFVFGALISNISFLFPKNPKNQHLDEWVYACHHVLHIFAIGILWALSLLIFKLENVWIILFYTAFWAIALKGIYTYYQTHVLTTISNLGALGLMFLHIMVFLEGRIHTQGYILSSITLMLLALPYLISFFQEKRIIFTPYFIVFLFYIFILSTLYVYDITQLTFAVTLYWGTLAFIVFSRGISKDILPLRTIGLYLISLTSIKVFLYDVWYNVDNLVSRVVVLIVLGILMIVLSTMYTRKFGNTLGKDFSPENLFGKKKDSTPKNERN